MMKAFLVFSSLACLIEGKVDLDSPVVKAKSGPIRGKLIQLKEARQDVYQFTGIPFAEPPVGDLRFKKPLPKTPWMNVLNATGVPATCIQVQSPGVDAFGPIMYPLIVEGMTISEDCLFLNIWAPKATVDAVTSGKSYKKLSVIAVLHGGGFITGTTMVQLYNGTMLSGFSNIIMVTIQYRLGSLGFAYFGKNDDAPGNAGLWDMTEGLKWISENIEAFGGNANSVTLAGESAGAAAVSYHLLSPYSRKYFQQAIMQSGTATAPWASHTPKAAIDVTDIVMSKVAPGKCDGSINNKSSIADKLKCLRSVDAMAIGVADGYPQSIGYSNGEVPTVDGDFLPKDPAEMLMSGDFYQCPMIMGSNKDEGSMLFLGNLEARKILPNPDNPKASLDALNYTHFKKLIEIGFAISSVEPQPIHPTVFNAIQLHYWPTKHDGLPKGREVSEAASQCLGDYSLGCPTYTWASVASEFLQKRQIPIYSYFLTQPSPKGMLPDWVGPWHGEDLIYIYGLPFTPYVAPGVEISKDEKQLCKIIMEYWGNFIKNGNPNTRDGQYVYCEGRSQACKLNNWPTFVGRDCDFQVMELNTETQVNSKPPRDIVTFYLKARECLFWSEYFPQLVDVVYGRRHKPAPRIEH